MRTAKQWMDEWQNGEDETVMSWIMAIQRDALLHAAKICRDLVSTSGSIRVECAKAIEAEADKLKL